MFRACTIFKLVFFLGLAVWLLPNNSFFKLIYATSFSCLIVHQIPRTYSIDVRLLLELCSNHGFIMK